MILARAALGYAAGVVAQKPVLRYVSPLTVTWMACMIGAVACLPYAPAFVHELGGASAATMGWMGSTAYLVPPVALLLGPPPLLAIPGGVLCLTGVALARRRPASPSLLFMPSSRSHT